MAAVPRLATALAFAGARLPGVEALAAAPRFAAALAFAGGLVPPGVKALAAVPGLAAALAFASVGVVAHEVGVVASERRHVGELSVIDIVCL
jgi:hypothetical protein